MCGQEGRRFFPEPGEISKYSEEQGESRYGRPKRRNFWKALLKGGLTTHARESLEYLSINHEESIKGILFGKGCKKLRISLLSIHLSW